MMTSLALTEQFENNSGVSVTIGGGFSESFNKYSQNVSIALSERPIPTALKALEEYKKKSSGPLSSQLSTLLVMLTDALRGLDVQDLKPLLVTEADDGSLLAEWTLMDRRLGFTLEPNEEHSGWYFAAAPSAGGHMASGSLQKLDLAHLLQWTLEEK